jgi:hypothetical protein
MREYYGVDLGTANTAIVKLFEDGSYTCQKLKHGNRPLVEFVDELTEVIKGQNVAVDFNLENFIYLPGTLLAKSLMYFIVGAIYSKADTCLIVSPDEIRNFHGLPNNISKKDFHKTVDVPVLPNNHCVDAYLLAQYAQNKLSV